MVRAILDGRKSQTRRGLKPQPPDGDWDVGVLTAEMIFPTVVDRHGEEQPGPECFGATCESGEWCLPCPYGQSGDLLWVRETWYPAFRREFGSSGCVYRADDDGIHLNPGWSPNGRGGGWKPSIFMPRWASRLTLRITGVRVERLQEISEEDASAEGVESFEITEAEVAAATSDSIDDQFARALGPGRLSQKGAYEMLWNEINGKGTWDLNPWVWVIEFERIQQQESAA